MMKLKYFFCIALLSPIWAYSDFIAANQYPFPKVDGSIAAIYASIIPAQNSNGVIEYLDYKPERRFVELEAGHRILSHYDFLSSKNDSKKLIVLIPGIGSNGVDNNAESIAAHIFKLGYNIITVQNPFSWKFAMGASKHGIVGNPNIDVPDLYKLINERIKKLNSKGYFPEEIGIVGYSLGAIYASHLDEYKEKLTGSPYKFLVMMNPPLNFEKVINLFDNDLEYFNSVPGYKSWLKGRFQNAITGAHTSDLSSPTSFQSLLAKNSLGTKEARQLITVAFKETLLNVISSAQVVKDHDVFEANIYRYRRDPFYREARKMGFRKYVKTFLNIASIENGDGPYSVKDFTWQNSLINHVSRIRKNSYRIHVFHNRDDYISKEVDIVKLHDLVGGSNMSVFPNGGHVASWSLGFPVNYQILNNTISKFFSRP